MAEQSELLSQAFGEQDPTARAAIYQQLAELMMADNVIIPIVKQAEYDQGRNTVTFNRFGQFFLRSKAGGGNGGDIEAEYINDIVVVGKGGYNPNGGPANSLMAIPVLYK